MAILIDGKLISTKKREDIKQRTEIFIKERGVVPGLAVVLVGDDAASEIYVSNKAKACEAVGFHSYTYKLPAETPQDDLLDLIDTLNSDDKVHGILCQLPLPKHLDEQAVINRISPSKDVDGFHPVNVGRLSLGVRTLTPCTPSGVMELLDAYQIDVSGKRCVIVGRSNLVGKPLAQLLLQKNGTVTVAHSKTKSLPELCKTADILVAAIGSPNFITAEYIKDEAVLIDVGINRLPNGKIVGDIDMTAAKSKSSYYTPVPGGVGPMTITMLLENTLRACADICDADKE